MNRSLIAAFLVALMVIVALVVVAVDRSRAGASRDAEIARLEGDERDASSFIYRVTDVENDVGVHDSAFTQAASDSISVALQRDRLSTTDRASRAGLSSAEARYRARMRSEAAASNTAMNRLVELISARYGKLATSSLRLDVSRLTAAREAAVTEPDPAVPDARTASPMRAYLEAVPPAVENAASLERRVGHDVVLLGDRMEREYRGRQKAYSDALERR